MEHGFNVSTDGNLVLPETEEDSKKGRPKGWTREQLCIQALILIGKGTIKHNAVLSIMTHNVVRYVPTQEHLLFLQMGITS